GRHDHWYGHGEARRPPEGQVSPRSLRNLDCTTDALQLHAPSPTSRVWGLRHVRGMSARCPYAKSRVNPYFGLRCKITRVNVVTEGRAAPPYSVKGSTPATQKRSTTSHE